MTNFPSSSRGFPRGTLPINLPLPFLPFVGDANIVTIGQEGGELPIMSRTTRSFFFASNILQDVADYREVFQSWFEMMKVGEMLAIEVPHSFLCEREIALPSISYPSRCRLYTPSSLLNEIEESLEPNSYRVRLMCDHDDGYNYEDDAPGGAQAVLVVIERILSPRWSLRGADVDSGPGPDFTFEPARTRHETSTTATCLRIVMLKLDHLGDFMMGVPALRKARVDFPDAHITLVVGSWNEPIARSLGIFDTVMSFDAFPRNSSEEKVDLIARVGEFARMISGKFDLAIDLRTDSDTRFFLSHVAADIRAGIGTRSQFPYLDIFLPIDGSRHGFEAAADNLIGLSGYAAAPTCAHGSYRISFDPDARQISNPLDPCLIYGPYLSLAPGEYLYEPHIEISDRPSMLLLDVAIDMKRVAHVHATEGLIPPLRFMVRSNHAAAEFRVFRVVGESIPSFSFYGGRLRRRGANSVLHQSEYISLLLDLVKMRTGSHGLLRESEI